MKSSSNNHAEHPLSTKIAQLEQEKEDLLSQNHELTRQLTKERRRNDRLKRAHVAMIDSPSKQCNDIASTPKKPKIAVETPMRQQVTVDLANTDSSQSLGGHSPSYQSPSAQVGLLKSPTSSDSLSKSASTARPSLKSSGKRLVKKTGTDLFDSLAPSEGDIVTTSDVTVATELTKMWRRGAFKQTGLTKSMLYDVNNKHFVGVPRSFPENSRYKNAMKAVAMGLTVQPNFMGPIANG